MKKNQRSFSIRKLLNVALPLCVLFLPALSGKQLASNAVVTVTEFSDFQCPYCKQAARVVEQLRAKYGNRVQFVFKQMPLPMHKQAFKAAQASVCAQEQGKFWEFHDRLFASSDISPANLRQIAAAAALNQDKFNRCLESDASRSAVQQDLAAADRLKVNGTPTFFINGTVVQGPATFEALRRQIEQHMVKRNHAASTTVTVTASSTPTPTPAATAIPSRLITLSPASIDFGYQLVGSTSEQVTETVSNSGTAPLVIKDIDVIGPDRNDFATNYAFTLPQTIAPDNSLQINLSFTATAPWKAGSRDAKLRLKIKEDDDKTVVPLTGIGATCSGPLAACSSGCADSDGDGLNDAWEIAGGIDVNNNGRVDRKHDSLLPGADPNKPDIFVKYDWMDYGLNDFACNTDLDCTNQGASHAGETCTGPATPSSSRTCVRACATDTDCTALGPSHVGDKCVLNRCEHTHDPEVLSPGALQAVADAFARHGFNLHIVRGHAVAHSHVVAFRQPASWCEGANVPTGTIGDYAVNLYDLKSLSFKAAEPSAYHYSLFSHYSGCDSDSNCGACPLIKGNSPQFGQTGQAEITGDDFVVSLGHFINDQGGAPTIFNVGGTFMHELGHNLGLHHGGGVTLPGTQCTDTQTCEDSPNYKPNYLSVMNYRYQFSGILEGQTVGSNAFRTCTSDADCSADGHCRKFGDGGICARLDFSNQTLPTAGNTPGALWENGQLNEPAGLGSNTSDLFDFDDGQCSFQVAATQGPVNWDGAGLPDNPNATSDLNSQDHPELACLIHSEVLFGRTDWGPAPGQSIFNLVFQCSPNGLADGAPFNQEEKIYAAQGGQNAQRELTPEMAMEAHVLYPPQPIRIEITPGCEEKAIASGRRGEFSVALLGSKDLDVREVETGSLRFHSATAIRTQLDDVNRDGKLDLVITFDQANLKISPQAKRGRLTGWLKSSQVFAGDDRVMVLP